MLPTDPPELRAARPLLPWDDLSGSGGLHSVYQPFIDLDTGEVLAHEALLRGPAGTVWESPLILLATAADAGRLLELELCSIRSALTGAARLSGGHPTTLFVNVEPSTLTRHTDVVIEALAKRAGTIQVVVEITERALAADVAGVLAGAERLRAAGCAIALDDVGIEPESLAFIPLLRPEVVKLDLALLRTTSDPDTITVTGAVLAYAEECGAEVVAEGIETSADLTRAQVLGATLGQGWWWGRGERRLAVASYSPERFAARPIGLTLHSTPYDLIESKRRLRRAPKRLLLPISHTLEANALLAHIPPVLLATFEHAQFFSAATAARYARLAARLPLVCALGQEMPRSPAPGVRGASLSAQDALVSQWTVVILGAHQSVALIARDLGDQEVDRDREFEFVLTYDRVLVTAAAHALIGRIAPATGTLGPLPSQRTTSADTRAAQAAGQRHDRSIDIG